MHKQMVHVQSSSDSLFDRAIVDAEVQAIPGADDNFLALLLHSLLGACITGSFVSTGALLFLKEKLNKSTL